MNRASDASSVNRGTGNFEVSSSKSSRRRSHRAAGTGGFVTKLHVMQQTFFKRGICDILLSPEPLDRSALGSLSDHGSSNYLRISRGLRSTPLVSTSCSPTLAATTRRSLHKYTVKIWTLLALGVDMSRLPSSVRRVIWNVL